MFQIPTHYILNKHPDLLLGRSQKDAPTVVPSSSSSSSYKSAASFKTSASNDEDEPQYVVEEELDSMREFFPSGFGKQSVKLDTQAALAKTRREGGVVVGPTRPGPAKPQGPVGPARPGGLVGPAKPSVGPAKPQVGPVGPAKPGPAKPAAREEGLVGPPRPPPAREEGLVGPPRPPPGSVVDDDSSDDEDDDHEDESESMVYEGEVEEEDLREKILLPVTHEISLRGHTKPVSALAMDPSGARLITGGMDYVVKLWDFGGMVRYFILLLHYSVGSLLTLCNRIHLLGVSVNWSLVVVIRYVKCIN